MNQQFFFKLAAELVEIAEADLRLNILTRDDGECENLKVTGMDKDSPDPCIRVEDEEGDVFYIFMRHIISITPVDAPESEEDEESAVVENENEATPEDA